MHQKFRNFASRPYWRSVQHPCRDVFEAGGSAFKKRKLCWDTKICYFQEIFWFVSHKVYSPKIGILYDDNTWPNTAQYLSQKKLKQCHFTHVAAANLGQGHFGDAGSVTPFRRQDVSAIVVGIGLYEKSAFLKYSRIILQRQLTDRRKAPLWAKWRYRRCHYSRTLMHEKDRDSAGTEEKASL